MFSTGGDPIRCRKVIALIALNHRRAEQASQIRVFAETLRDPPPTRVTRNVDHRRECPIHTSFAGFCARIVRAGFHQVGVPAGSLRQWNREDSLEPMDHVTTDQQWDPVFAFFERDALQLIA